MALYMMVFLGATPIGSPIVGWIGQTYGARSAIGVGSIIALLVATGAALWAGRSGTSRVRYHVRTRPHLEVALPTCRSSPRQTAAPAGGAGGGGPPDRGLRSAPRRRRFHPCPGE